MKKTTIFLVLILLHILTFSCSTDSNSEPQEPGPTEKKLVKREKIADTRQVDYTYNSNNLLSSWTGVYNGFEYVSGFTYNSDNKLIEWGYQETGSSSYSDTYAYTYNSNGLLSSYSSNSENVTLVYNGTTVTLTGTIEGNQNSQAVLDLNNNGLIIKLTKSNRYTNFGYDSVGNLISAKSYDNTNNLLSEFTLQYDNKINPFYGQFGSIYIERFVEFFWEFDSIYINSFEGYSFPFQKNNITAILKAGGETTTYSYLYDSDNYPTKINGASSGDNFTFQIEYF